MSRARRFADKGNLHSLVLNATDGSATDAGDNLILNGTDATSANADSSILFEDITNDGSAVLIGDLNLGMFEA